MFFDFFLLFVVSFIANAFSAFAGGGAGLIQLPLLIFLGLPFSLALATHKVASVALGLGATLRHLRTGNIDIKTSLVILISGIPGVIVGGFIIVNVANTTAEILLGCLTISLGLYSIKQKEFGQHYIPKNRSIMGYLQGSVGLFLIGVLNGSLTSGTGLFVTLWIIYWFGFDYKRAIAHTLILVGIFWNGSGAITLGLLSQIQWDWLPPLIVGSLLGGYAGSHLAIVSGNQWIKRVFEFVTILIGFSLIFS